jgi:hypothetical protein
VVKNLTGTAIRGPAGLVIGRVRLEDRDASGPTARRGAP